MKARIKAPYKCAPEGYRIVHFAVGEIVEGQVAEWAVADGCANKMPDAREMKVIGPTEKKRGRPPKVKAE